ncbi:hypothetical protein WMF26_06645 [Sorangium sp. So ce185]|uniref:hypothetical protein n=1 Tax=Sorangium sp. So ce185 TaxID=3133287 RepID=UPI003F6324DD
MKIAAYHVGLGLITFSSVMGCVAAEDGSFGEEDTAESAEALGGNPDPCAMGLDPNFTSPQLTAVGASEDYARSYQWIDSICPAGGLDRATTIVDFPVPNYYQHQSPETYRFDVAPTFWGSSSTSWSNASQAMSDCENTKMATRMQRWDWATNKFVELTFKEQAGAWVWDNPLAGRGHCSTPTFTYYHENYGTAQQVATSKYRVRTWAKQSDGSHATVWITGTHTAL